jgi:hypothetical protein
MNAPNGLRVSRRERAAHDHVKKPTISRAKRSAACACSAVSCSIVCACMRTEMLSAAELTECCCNRFGSAHPVDCTLQHRPTCIFLSAFQPPGTHEYQSDMPTENTKPSFQCANALAYISDTSALLFHFAALRARPALDMRRSKSPHSHYHHRPTSDAEVPVSSVPGGRSIQVLANMGRQKRTEQHRRTRGAFLVSIRSWEPHK